jgi:HAD superfamily hydrolase (TIGR01549 family)
MPPAAILDIDGTLVDTNYHHAIAWYRAFRRNGVLLPAWRIHRHIGMGGDHLVKALAGGDLDREKGDDIRDAEKQVYAELIDEVEPLEGAAGLIRDLKERGHTVVLASSAKEEEVEHYIDLLGAQELADGWTTSADVEGTKPEPDLIQAAMAKAGDDDAVMVGDTTFDCEAAGRAGLETVAVLTGGFSKQELMEAGAVAVFDSVEELRGSLDRTPLALRS